MDNLIFKLEKKYVKKVIIDSQLSSEGIINMHRLNTQNSGDIQSAPYLYFTELKNYQKVDILGYISYNPIKPILWTKYVMNNDIILGGGGLFDRPSFAHSVKMASLLNRKGRKVVVWGAGHNNPLLHPSKLFYKQISNFKLIGIRDYGIKGTEWVPCASCMHEIFDKNFEIKFEIGIVEHEHLRISSNTLSNIPTIKNNSPFEDIVKFIGSLDVLITNSYHAMYWAMLLNRKVIVIPNSSKMLSFKYHVPLCYNFQDYKNYLNKTRVYSGLLQECREINKVFALKVFDYLNL